MIRKWELSGNKEMEEYQAGKVVLKVPPWSAGQVDINYHLATLLKQVGKGNSNLKPIVHQNQLSCHLWHDCFGLSVLSFRNCKKGHITMYFSRDEETRTKGQMWPAACFCK